MVNKVVVFDFFGVICSEVAPFWLEKYLSKESAEEAKATIVHSADLGEISLQDLFAQLGKIAGVSPTRVESEWWSYVSIDGDVVEIVRKLRDHVTVALLTNSPAQFVLDVLAKYRLGQLFNPVVISSEEHCAKPDPAIYKRILRKLDTSPVDVLMIDDNPVNVTAAQGIGMNAIHFKSASQLRGELSTVIDSRLV
ncbi:MAG: HAD family phosphatase [Thaumarchaeota archaeon]|nr:HAD family phosphatase [Nitrososphaerota archaeon]